MFPHSTSIYLPLELHRPGGTTLLACLSSVPPTHRESTPPTHPNCTHPPIFLATYPSPEFSPTLSHPSQFHPPTVSLRGTCSRLCGLTFALSYIEAWFESTWLTFPSPLHPHLRPLIHSFCCFFTSVSRPRFISTLSYILVYMNIFSHTGDTIA